VEDSAGLSMSPPAHAVVLSNDEKFQIQLETSKNPLSVRFWGTGCGNDGREHGIVV
jgi:hypothetical protein